ncbi:MAG: hypothetical protein HQL09_01650 [Nitrospirae bacterium]|nr:hypothetical protein [Nitrospirota bacterium]
MVGLRHFLYIRESGPQHEKIQDQEGSVEPKGLHGAIIIAASGQTSSERKVTIEAINRIVDKDLGGILSDEEVKVISKCVEWLQAAEKVDLSYKEVKTVATKAHQFYEANQPEGGFYNKVYILFKALRKT